MAVAAPGSAFAGWSGAGCSGTVPLCAVVVSANQSLTAIFTATGPVPMSSLSVQRIGSGSGTVTSAQGGINCGNTCTAAFPTASSVTLTARPAGWRINLRWLGWRLHGRWALHGHHEQRSDGHCAVRPGAGSGHLDCEYIGARGGRVTSLPIGISCGDIC
jgi:hypothetical protein